MRAARVERAAAALVAATAAIVVGCAAASGAGRPGAGHVTSVEEGRASYYSHSFAGRRTASGERYNPAAMTAAHPSLPFGTRVRVIRRGGPSVEVRINDRCGCGGGRIIDLSEAAARRLGMMRAGVIEVRLEVVGK